MIYTKCFDRVKPDGLDEIWMIVRSWKNPVPQIGDVPVRHVPELSPSRPLLDTYIASRDKGEWDYEKFTNRYLPCFLAEFNENSAVTEPLLEELCKKDSEGKNICLVCFCDDERLCHRSIIAALLKQRGVSVVTETGDDYTSLLAIYDDITILEKNLPQDAFGRSFLRYVWTRLPDYTFEEPKEHRVYIPPLIQGDEEDNDEE